MSARIVKASVSILAVLFNLGVVAFLLERVFRFWGFVFSIIIALVAIYLLVDYVDKLWKKGDLVK